MRLGVAGALVGGVYRAGDVQVDRETGRITAIGLSGPGTGVAIPGLVDIQVNGFAGVDFLAADLEQYAVAGSALARSGVQAFQTTLITAPLEVTQDALATAAKAQAAFADDETAVPRVLGVHLEGPFLSPARPGTHPPGLLRAPDVGLARRLLAAGPVTQITLAPELPGALQVIDEAVRAGTLVAIGHSDADAAAAHAAFDHGARLVTHLFDAMHPFTHRDPGLVGAALTREGILLGLIADPSHLSTEAIRLAFAAAPGRVVLVTDALAAAGCPDGNYRLGQVDFQVHQGVAHRADGTLVGSTLTLIDAVRNAHAAGIALHTAVNAATLTPATLFPHAPISLLRPGQRADLLILDDTLAVRTVLRAGTQLEP